MYTAYHSPSQTKKNKKKKTNAIKRMHIHVGEKYQNYMKKFLQLLDSCRSDSIQLFKSFLPFLTHTFPCPLRRNVVDLLPDQVDSATRRRIISIAGLQISLEFFRKQHLSIVWKLQNHLILLSSF